jgi:hypothetical protein
MTKVVIVDTACHFCGLSLFLRGLRVGPDRSRAGSRALRRSM